MGSPANADAPALVADEGTHDVSRAMAGGSVPRQQDVHLVKKVFGTAIPKHHVLVLVGADGAVWGKTVEAGHDEQLLHRRTVVPDLRQPFQVLIVARHDDGEVHAAVGRHVAEPHAPASQV